MSEQDRPESSSSKITVTVIVVSILLGGGCLVSCAGLVGLGFYVPVQQRRVMELKAQQEEQVKQLKIQAELVRQKKAAESAEPGDSPARADTATDTPAVDGAETKQMPDGEVPPAQTK